MSKEEKPMSFASKPQKALGKAKTATHRDQPSDDAIMESARKIMRENYDVLKKLAE